MLFFRIFIIVILTTLILGFLVKLFADVATPREKAVRARKVSRAAALDKARIEYNRVRQAWLDHSLKSGEDMVALYMMDMKIKSVAKFQRLMVQLDTMYGKVTLDDDVDEVFVQQVTSLKELYEKALHECEKRSIM